MAAAVALLGRAQAAGDRLVLEGEPLTAERLRGAMREVCWERGALLGPEAIVASVWQGYGHEPGSGPLPIGLPIQIDLWPQDVASSCWADMTRTFVVGAEPPEEVRRQERLVLIGLDEARASARPGLTGRELDAGCCEIFEREGYRTQRTGPGEDRNEGFQFSLGHGGRAPRSRSAEPRPDRKRAIRARRRAGRGARAVRDVGGVRFEDLLLITEAGCERLTEFPYDMRVG